MIEHNKSYGDIFALSTNIEMLKNYEEELNTIEHPENNSLLFKGKPKKCYYVIDSILPGTYSVFEQKFRVLATWRFIRHQIPYHMFQLGFNTNNMIDTNKLLQEAINKRIGNKQVNVIFTGNYESFMTAAIANEKLGEQEKYVNTFSFSSSTIYEKDVKLVTDHLKTNHTVVTITDADIENEKENINPEFTDNGRLWSEPLCGSSTNFGELWLMAKTIARISPNSVVFLEINIDELDFIFKSNLIDEGKNNLFHLDFQYWLSNYFKTICQDKLNKISKIFWYHGLEVEIPWLDNALVQQLVKNCKNIEFTFNPIGVYGNKLLPEELLI